MTLRSQSFIIIGFKFLGLVSFLSITLLIAVDYTFENVRDELLQGFGSIETSVMENAGRTVMLDLEEQQRRLASHCEDWAFWNDTYEFIAERSEEYRVSNLQADSLRVLGADIVIFADSQQNFVFSLAMDFATGKEIPFPESFKRLFTAFPLLNRMDGEARVLSGLVLLPEGPVIVAVAPILPSTREGPPRGTLVFARYLNKKSIERVQAATRLDITVERIDRLPLPDDLHEALQACSEQDVPFYANVTGDNSILGYCLLRDLTSEPVAFMKFSAARPIYQQCMLSMYHIRSAGRRLLMMLGLSLFLVSSVVSILMLVSVEKSVLKPLAKLATQAGEIAKSGDFSARMDLHTRNEFNTVATSMNEMLDTLEGAHSTMAAHEARKSMLMQMAPIGILAADRDLRIRTGYSQACERLFDQQDLDGRSLRDLLLRIALEPDEVRAFTDRLAGLSCKGANTLHNIESEICVRKPRSTEGFLRLLCLPLDAPPANLEEVLVLASDITSERREEDALLQAKEAAEAANKTKSRFVANVSHEIRTPLNAITGYTELALRLVPDGPAREYLNNVSRETETLLHIVNDLLDQARIETGRLVLEFAPFRLENLLQQVVSGCHVQAQSKGLALITEVASETPRDLIGDVLRLRQVLVNLVVNALKFTEVGNVSIYVARISQDEDRAIIRFAVKDTGIGIPDDARDRVFQTFSQVDSTYTRRYGGAGLGAAIARELVELMGGEMGFESRLGHGSVFWFTAPFTVAYTESATDAESVSPLPLPTAPVVESAEDTPSGYILVAEDYPPNQEVVKILLEEAGHRLDIVENGRLAVQAAAIRSYDLILMDLQMPEMDGLEATRLIRKSDGPCAGIPIVALTAHADQREEELCREAGMDGVIVKPIRFATFIKTVNESLPKKVKTTDSDEADRPTPDGDDAPGSADNADPISLDELTDAFGRNPGLAKSVLRDFVLQFRSQWTQIETAAKDGDLETLRRETHKIRGAAGNLTAWDLSDAATKVENAAKAGDAGTASLEFEVFEREYFRLCEYADRVLDAGSA